MTITVLVASSNGKSGEKIALRGRVKQFMPKAAFKIALSTALNKADGDQAAERPHMGGFGGESCTSVHGITSQPANMFSNVP